MTSDCFCFDDFVLDCADRQLLRDGEPVELNSRYLDALGLLVRENGRLVSKGRFLDEVWRGVPVTDEALTQCIRTLRRSLGDDASRPRFIETVPKHGYRFIAAVEAGQEHSGAPMVRAARDWRQVLAIGSAATIGGGMAGFIGGLFYGFVAASHPQGSGALSVVAVVLSLTVIVALLGGAGVGFGIALAGVGEWRRSAFGGAAGGLVVGAVVKLLGIDAFHLFFGEAPGQITGGMEGALLGAAAGSGAWYAARSGTSLRRSAAAAAVAGGAAGFAIRGAGGRLMGASLDLVAHSFPASRLRLDSLGSLLGEPRFGPITQTVTAPLEGALFATCVAIAVRTAIHWRFDRRS